jgi:thiol-disulfide isomerase/thioredoxin
MQRVLLLLLPSAFLLSPVLSAQEITKEQRDKIRQLYQDAQTARMDKDYAKANGELRELLKLLPRSEKGERDPNLSRIYFDMGCNYALLGKKKEAYDHLGRAVDSGFWNHEFLAREPALKDLREEKEFAAILDKSRRGLPDIAFGLNDLSGKEIRKDDYKGKALLIDVWGTWCFPCRMEIPHFIRLQKLYGKDGFAVIGLTWEKRPPDETIEKRVAKFVKDNQINYVVAMIPKGRLFSIPRFSGFPTTLYIGRDGLLKDRVVGAEGYDAIEKRVKKLLADKKSK